MIAGLHGPDVQLHAQRHGTCQAESAHWLAPHHVTRCKTPRRCQNTATSRDLLPMAFPCGHLPYHALRCSQKHQRVAASILASMHHNPLQAALQPGVWASEGRQQLQRASGAPMRHVCRGTQLHLALRMRILRNGGLLQAHGAAGDLRALTQNTGCQACPSMRLYRT